MSKEDDIEKALPESSRASLDDDGQSSSSTLLEKPSQNKTPEEAGIKLPAEDATADEVRAYLVDILTLSHGLQHAEARQIASVWLAGTGRELRKYPGKMYHEIFGAQAGWMLYKEIKIAVVKEGYEKNPARTWAGKLSLCSAIIGAMVAVTSLGVLLGPVMWAISIPLYFCGLVGLLCVLLETRRAPEDVAERELVEIWDSQREVGGQGSK